MDYTIKLRRVPGISVGDLVLPLVPVGLPEVDQHREAGEVVAVQRSVFWVKFPSDPDLSFQFQAGELEKVKQ